MYPPTLNETIILLRIATELTKPLVSVYAKLITNEVQSYNYASPLSDGPENMAIKGIKEAEVGQTVQINCSFASYPIPTFVWKFNDSVLVGETKQCFIIQMFENKDSGIYTCEAFNNVTGLRNTANHNLMLKGKDRAQTTVSLFLYIILDAGTSRAEYSVDQ